jgi:hypothetical protein
LVDVGMAGVCAYAQRQRPEDLTLEDLDRVSTFMVDTYYQAKLGTYLSCVFMNASFVQPNESAAKRKQFRIALRILRSSGDLAARPHTSPAVLCGEHREFPARRGGFRPGGGCGHRVPAVPADGIRPLGGASPRSTR